MAAQLNSTVYVQDPDTRQTIELAEGSSPEPRLAALVTNPAAWVDGKLPRLPKTQTDSSQSGQDPTGDGQDAGSGADSGPSDADNEAATAAKKTAARKSAATTRSRGRNAADQGDSGE